MVYWLSKRGKKRIASQAMRKGEPGTCELTNTKKIQMAMHLYRTGATWVVRKEQQEEKMGQPKLKGFIGEG